MSHTVLFGMDAVARKEQRVFRFVFYREGNPECALLLPGYTLKITSWMI
jgi:hypothetical protein